jgi:hypothetical protein
MTSPDLPPDVPANEPVDVPAASPRRWRWPARRPALALAGAFLLGACLCGGAGLAIGTVASHGFAHVSNDDGRGGHTRDDNGRLRRDDRHPDKTTPTSSAPATAAPTPAAPTPTLSVNATPTTSPS